MLAWITYHLKTFLSAVQGIKTTGYSLDDLRWLSPTLVCATSSGSLDFTNWQRSGNSGQIESQSGHVLVNRKKKNSPYQFEKSGNDLLFLKVQTGQGAFM